ncbi:hypothetical protein KC19_VG195300 [Ceratodon purpureus]|uniref:Uncharacterized protein n=1 Tax=Ceratodon purpureus TaxID=3225 RepID=A0A8T0HRP2_CERPU|nr:hypothetical protein KC19_VG195300 [Ceratodon purpureus]
MSTPVRMSMEELCAVIVNGLSISQTFLLGLWVFFHLLHRLARSSADWLRRRFLDSFAGDNASVQREPVVCEAGFDFSSPETLESSSASGSKELSDSRWWRNTAR